MIRSLVTIFILLILQNVHAQDAHFDFNPNPYNQPDITFDGDSQAFEIGKEKYSLILRTADSDHISLELLNREKGTKKVLLRANENLSLKEPEAFFMLSSYDSKGNTITVNVMYFVNVIGHAGPESNTFSVFATHNGGLVPEKIVVHKKPMGDFGLEEFVLGSVPEGWDILAAEYSDLNKDSIEDAAIILEELEGTGEFGKKRELRIYFGGDEPTLVCTSPKAVLEGEAGGLLGDPFEKMSIAKGVLRLDFFGGSRDKWNLTYRYRYQNGGFYMIGATNKGGDGIEEYSYDWNLSNGKMIISVKNSEDPKKNKSETRTVKLPALPKLETFQPWTLKFEGDIVY